MIRERAAAASAWARTASGVFGPLMNLVVRLWLAGAFLLAQMHEYMSATPTPPGGGLLHGVMVSAVVAVVEYLLALSPNTQTRTSTMSCVRVFFVSY